MADEAGSGAMSGAASGAAAGAAAGPWGAVIGAGIGAIGGAIGGKGAKKARRAAAAAAMQKQAMTREAFNRTTGIAEKTTVRGLADFDKSLALQERNMARQEKLVSEIDPTIIEASQQALKLMRGDTSSTLAPMQNQRNQQRQQLVNSLRAQLGPGAETSSAGQQALSNFDSQSSSLFANAQQNAISNLGQTFGHFSQYKPSLSGEAASFANLAQGRVGIGMDNANFLQGAYAPMIGSAGANQVGNMMKGQFKQQMGNQFAGAAGGLASAYGGGFSFGGGGSSGGSSGGGSGPVGPGSGRLNMQQG